MVLGVVLPDFIKNAQKDCNLYPVRVSHLFEEAPHQVSLLKGWKKHIEVDRLFHSSTFFQVHTNELKKMILGSCEDSPVKPFFLAHIGLELMLDHLLTTDGLVNINAFYDQLAKADRAALNEFLHACSLEDTEIFFNFLNGFISSRYLLSYQKIENITYALNRICMRLWDNPFTDSQLSDLTVQLSYFKDHIKDNYLSIFAEIELDLRNQ